MHIIEGSSTYQEQEQQQHQQKQQGVLCVRRTPPCEWFPLSAALLLLLLDCCAEVCCEPMPRSRHPAGSSDTLQDILYKTNRGIRGAPPLGSVRRHLQFVILLISSGSGSSSLVQSTIHSPKHTSGGLELQVQFGSSMWQLPMLMSISVHPNPPALILL